MAKINACAVSGGSNQLEYFYGHVYNDGSWKLLCEVGENSRTTSHIYTSFGESSPVDGKKISLNNATSGATTYVRITALQDCDVKYTYSDATSLTFVHLTSGQYIDIPLAAYNNFTMGVAY